MQKEYECIVFLPIRDTTFDHHRKEPPLDTVIKDLSFRIDPPPLMEVIYKRAKYALSLMDSKDNQVLSYLLPNNMRVEYPLSELGIYISCILRSLFSDDNFFRRLITGIAGRDTRRGLEIFLDFCKSGHISAAEILKIRQSQGSYILHKHIIIRVLLRGNRRFYHDASSYIKNLFFSSPDDTTPDPFVRVSILKWLDKRYRIPGPNGIKGYHKVSDLISNITPLGHAAERINIELINLAKAGCIETESQDPTYVSEDELVIISPSGHVHLDLLEDISYLAACSEDVWYKDSNIASAIAKRITNQEGSGHFSRESTIENAAYLIDYLSKYQENIISSPASYLANDTYNDTYDEWIDLREMKDKLNYLKKQMVINEPNEELIKEYPAGKILEVEVVSKQTYGLFVEFGLNGRGFIPASLFLSNREGPLLADIETGDILSAEIILFNKKYNRFNLKPA